jgi:hydrogenase-4 component B
MPALVGLWCVATLLGLSAAAIVVARIAAGRFVVYGVSFAVSLAGLANGLHVLIGTPIPEPVVLPLALPGIGAHFRVDALAAFFLVVANLGGAAASLYALGYGRHEQSPLRVLPFFPAYLAGMNLVVLADDAFSFLIAWEFMSLTSWALVLANHRAAENRRAGLIYLLMASFGTLTLVLAFGLLAGAVGDYSFAAIRASRPAEAAGLAVFLLALVGAGSKAGLVPLHVWLPLAHPAAPSHVSALMSGVMTKIAVYAVMRFTFDLLGPSTPAMSMVVLGVGGISAAAGVLYAMMQQDLKRLLAYSTVENIGIIFVGIGLAMAFRASEMNFAAALALTAACFHILNHAIFKSLLFFSAGAVLHATGERDMDRLGGLIHRMPKTAIVFLVGCMAIAALPPLNGFVSEWLTFQAILVSPQISQWGPRFLIPAVGALLALSAALAAACFVKAYGIAFLGRPRSDAAANAHETDGFSLAAMVGLAALCVLLGAIPGAVVDLISPVAQALVGARMPTQSHLPWLSLVPIAESRSSYNGLIILFFIVVSGTATALFIHRFATRATRRSDIWDCGYPDPSTASQYSGSSFAMPIRRVFGNTVFDVREKVEFRRPGDIGAARYQIKILDPLWRYVYGPLARWVLRFTVTLNQLQFLTIRSYLTLVFATLILLLLVVAAWR